MYQVNFFKLVYNKIFWILKNKYESNLIVFFLTFYHTNICKTQNKYHQAILCPVSLPSFARKT